MTRFGPIPIHTRYALNDLVVGLQTQILLRNLDAFSTIVLLEKTLCNGGGEAPKEQIVFILKVCSYPSFPPSLRILS